MLPLWITLSVAVALAMAGFIVYRRFFSRQTSGRDDRYTPERILTSEQVAMLDYLRDTFPNQVVLPNMQLADLLSIRRSNNHHRAKERLKQHKVDFVVCGDDGRPQFAFDIEQFHLSNAKARAHQVKLKNRILKTAGVRFLFLKNGIHRMPSPADFRAQLNLAALPQPTPKDEAQTESVRQQLESKLSQFDQLYTQSDYRDSEVMGMSSLMSLEDEDSDRLARQRMTFSRARAH